MQRRSIRHSDPRYKQLRIRNNESVKKSREKSRREHEEIIESIHQLEKENQQLIGNIQLLKQEYEQLQTIFKQHTGIDMDQSLTNSSQTTSEDLSTKPVLTITTTTTTDETTSSSSDNQLDANSLDGSIVLINGFQYKIVSMK